MLDLDDGAVLRRVRVDDVQHSEHALVQGFILRVRPPLEAVVHIGKAKGVGPVVDRSQIINIHGDVNTAVRRPTCVEIIFSTPSTRRLLDGVAEKRFTG